MTITISFTGAESVVQRRAALNALVAYAAAFNDIGADAPDVGKPAPAPEAPTPVPAAAAAFTPPAPAPVAPPPAPQPEAAVELDSEGQPWNAELHASTKAKIADGTWRKKRGAAPEAPPAPPAPAPAGAMTFATFMAKVMPLIKDGKIAGLRINELCQSFGIANMGSMSKATADQMDAVLAMIEAEAGV